MKRTTLSWAVVAAFALAAAFGTRAQEAANAAPVSPVEEISVKCTMCNGKGGYTARPPDLDQHRGTLDSREHWDIKVKKCPFCEGKGRRRVYDLERRQPQVDTIPCRLCGWNGIRLCTRCTATGFLKCTNKDCDNGWIARKAKGRKSTRRADSVEMCPECHGKGKMICTFCRGMRAEICPRCNGMGRDLEKEAKERERRRREEERAKEREVKEAAKAAREAAKAAKGSGK